VKLKTATKWLIVKRFQHAIDSLLHFSGLNEENKEIKADTFNFFILWGT
jgi:hypothetical protein